MHFVLDEAIPLLSRTPAALRSLLGDLPEVWTASRGDRTDWRPFDIVGHLIHGEKTDWIPRATVILEHGTSLPFEPFDREAMFDQGIERPLSALLDEFERLRNKNLATLRSWSLTEHDLTKTGVHPDFGVVTLSQLLATWTVHDLNHIFQITRVMSREYRSEVGPWIEYLGVLA